jgi:hypothetical protein
MLAKRIGGVRKQAVISALSEKIGWRYRAEIRKTRTGTESPGTVTSYLQTGSRMSTISRARGMKSSYR